MSWMNSLNKNMENVLELVKNQNVEKLSFPDEAYFSNMTFASNPFCLRALANMREDEREKKQKENGWICEETDKIRVLLMDQIVDRIDSNRRSMDAFMYHFHKGDSLNYLIEFKKEDKGALLKKLDDGSEGSIYEKANDCKLLICNEIIFGGVAEAEELISKTHIVLVYCGKNNVASFNTPRVPRGKDYRQKKINTITTQFGEKVGNLGYAECSEDEFPVPGMIKAKKEKGKEKVRKYSVFSDTDMAEIIHKGFFDNWDWGDIDCSSTESV